MASPSSSTPSVATGAGLGGSQVAEARGMFDGMGQLNDGRGLVPLAPVSVIAAGRPRQL